MATTVTTPRTGRRSGASIEFSGLAPEHHVHWNYGPAELVEHAIRRKEGMLADGGPFCAVTSPHTGRSPNDKFVVKEASSEAKVWWGKVNQPIAPELACQALEAVIAGLRLVAVAVGRAGTGDDQRHRRRLLAAR